MGEKVYDNYRGETVTLGYYGDVYAVVTSVRYEKKEASHSVVRH